jgi:hypothetical protein
MQRYRLLKEGFKELNERRNKLQNLSEELHLCSSFTGYANTRIAYVILIHTHTHGPNYRVDGAL